MSSTYSEKKSWNSSIPLTLGIGLFPFLFLLFFFFVPLAAIFRLIFSQVVENGFGLQIWVRVGHVLIFTLWQAFLSTLLTVAVGLPVSYLFGRYQFWGKKILQAFMTVPFILPTVVVAVGFNALIGPHGWINILLMRVMGLPAPPLQILNTLWAILLAHVFYNTVVVVRIVGNGWAQVDTRLEQAARSMGASSFRVFTEITLPLVKPFIFSAVLLVFLFDFTSYGVILLLGGPSQATLEVEIFIQAMQLLNLPAAGLLSLIQLGFTGLITGIYTWADKHWAKPGSKNQTFELKAPAKWQEKLLISFVAISLCLFLLSPLAALSIRSVTRLEADRGERGQVHSGLTLDYYQELFINRRNSYFYVPPIQAAANSLTFAGVTVVITLPLGMATTYVLKRQKSQGRWIEMLVMLPLGASAVTLGLGFLLVFNRPPFDPGHFPWLISIAHSLIAFPFVVRVLLPAWRAVPVSLNQAAGVLGASPWKTWWHVELPILIRPILSAIIFSFTISMGEFGATSFLAVPEKPTLPLAIYRFLSQPGDLNYGQSLAMATLLMLVCTLAIVLIEYIQPEQTSVI